MSADSYGDAWVRLVDVVKAIDEPQDLMFHTAQDFLISKVEELERSRGPSLPLPPTRYDIDSITDGAEGDYEASSHIETCCSPTGEWVKWKDVERLFATDQQARE